MQLYIDYIDCVTRIPELNASARLAVLDAVEASELERLNAAVPRLIQMLPSNLSDRNNWKHNVCIARMLSKLLELQLPTVCLSSRCIDPRADYGPTAHLRIRDRPCQEVWCQKLQNLAISKRLLCTASLRPCSL